MDNSSFNPYQPPKADVNQAPSDIPGGPVSYYVMQPGQLMLLSVVTMGFFFTYWGYRQWLAVRRSGVEVSPVGRAIFLIFCIHSLFRGIQRTRLAAGLSQGKAQSGSATLFIVLSILANLVSRSTTALGMLFSIAITLGASYSVAAAQTDINELAARTGTTHNSGMGAGGVVLVVLGILIFAFSVLGALHAFG